MAIDLRKNRFAKEFIGVDNRPEHAAEALKLGIVDRIAVGPKYVTFNQNTS